MFAQTVGGASVSLILAAMLILLFLLCRREQDFLSRVVFAPIALAYGTFLSICGAPYFIG
jgi:ABC-type Fe3+-siderophore transport system permease subunit